MKVLNNRRFDKNHGLNFTRCLALILSALAMIGSIGIMGFGIQVLVEVSFTSTIIGTSDIVYCPYILIVIGILTFGLTPVGFYSIIIQDPKLTILHMFGTFFISGLCIASGSLGYMLNNHVSGVELTNWMKQSIKEEYGNPNDPWIAENWDKAHQQYKCCGALSINDFINSKWYAEQKHLPRKRLPESCCASCATIHEKFCVAFFVDTKKVTDKLIKNQTICLQASKRCVSADTSFANKDVCLGSAIDYQYSADAYRHTDGCINPIRNNLDTITRFVHHEITDPLLMLSFNHR